MNEYFQYIPRCFGVPLEPSLLDLSTWTSQGRKPANSFNFLILSREYANILGLYKDTGKENGHYNRIMRYILSSNRGYRNLVYGGYIMVIFLDSLVRTSKLICTAHNRRGT